MEPIPSISVIIPTYRDDVALSNLLGSLISLEISEIIISDAQPRSIPSFILAQQDSLPITYIHASKCRGPQIKKAISKSRSEYVWVLHADSEPNPNSIKAIHSILSDRKNSMGCFPIEFSSSSLLLRCFAFFSHIESLFSTFGDQGFFFRKSDMPRQT